MIKHARRNLDVQFVVFDGTNLSDVIELCGADLYIKKYNCSIDELLGYSDDDYYHLAIHESIGAIRIYPENVIVLDDGLVYIFDNIQTFHELYDEYEEII